MGRPLNKRNFGTTTTEGEIEVKFWDSVGAAEVTGWIIAQKGSKKFRVTDGLVTETCFLKWPGPNTAEGEMTIGLTNDAGGAQFVQKISGRKATLDNGEVVGWLYTANVADDDRGTIDETGGYATGDPIAAPDMVNATSYVIIELGDTDFTLVGATSNTVGEVFTSNNTVNPFIGTGVVKLHVA